MDEIRKTGDVPTSLRHGRRVLPLGRYLRRKMRQELDLFFVDPKTGEVKYDTPRENLSQYRKELLVMLKDTLNDPSADKEAKTSIKNMLISKNQGKIASIEARAKIFGRRNKI